MMRPVGDEVRIYLHRLPIDMRTGRNGLAALARDVMGQDPFGGGLFVFAGKRFNTLKILYWDRNGFVVWHKLIEGDQKYHWPRLLQDNVVSLTVQELTWLLDGYDIWTQPHEMLKFVHVS